MNDDPGCPVLACANFLGFPDWEGPYGIAAEPRRFYLSDVIYGGSTHLFMIAVAAPDDASLEAFIPDAEGLISTVRVPVSPGLKGCVPACGESDLVAPGDLPAGEYQTEWFFGGEMRLTFDAGWTSPEDSTGEFHATPIENAEENDIFFWEDVYPVENGKRVKGVPLTVAGLLDWMESSTQLEVSAPVRGTIGDLPASVVDVRIADDAVDDDPKNCPFRACALFLGFPQWHGIFGITGPQIQRYYLADVTYGGRDHLFVALIYAATPAVMKTLRPAGERLISTVRVPASPG